MASPCGSRTHSRSMNPPCAFESRGKRPTARFTIRHATREKLRLVAMGLPRRRPSGGALISGGGLFIPLDSGRCVLMNWQTGAPLGSPFQPASDPSGRVQWTNPVRLPGDPDQMVIADSRKKLYRLRVGEQIRVWPKPIYKAFLGRPPPSTKHSSRRSPDPRPIPSWDTIWFAEAKLQTQLEGRVAWGPVVSVTSVCCKRMTKSCGRSVPTGEERLPSTCPPVNRLPNRSRWARTGYLPDGRVGSGD